MKPFPYVIAFCACLPVLAAADAVTFGGGFNSSSTDLDVAGVEYSNRPGFNLGVGYEANIVPGVYLVPELNLETRGQDAGQDLFPFSYRSSLRLLYLQIPVFAMVKAPVGAATLEAFAGPSLGFLLSAKLRYESNGQEQTNDVKDDMDPVGLGLEFGAGIAFPVGAGSFFVRPGYSLGLTNAEDDAYTEAFRLRNAKLKVGFTVPLRASGP